MSYNPCLPKPYIDGPYNRNKHKVKDNKKLVIESESSSELSDKSDGKL